MFSRLRNKLDRSKTPPQSTPPAPAPRSDITFANAAYYPNWRVYTHQPPSSLRLGCVSHIFYAFAWYFVITSLLQYPANSVTGLKKMEQFMYIHSPQPDPGIHRY